MLLRDGDRAVTEPVADLNHAQPVILKETASARSPQIVPRQVFEAGSFHRLVERRVE